ncbi:conserved protein, unknown function [Hepatocystis sp. ex Piliocolobus tephrosceles]|nr:conserved protein, unknown function [Hepatocystis sp. ex Piliocolobus tephrosceles]
MVPQKLIVHYNHCSIKDIGDVFIDSINVELFFLKNVLNCPFIHFVKELHPFSNYGSFPYAFNTLEGNILRDEEIIDYMKNLYAFDSLNYELYLGILKELKIILIYFLWANDKIYNNYTNKLYNDNFFYIYRIYLLWKLRKQNIEKYQMKGLNNYNFNLKRLKEILNILDSVLCDSKNIEKGTNICYFHIVCFSILSIFFSIPLEYNKELQDVLLSNPRLISFVENLNNRYNVWTDKKSFLGCANNNC